VLSDLKEEGEGPFLSGFGNKKKAPPSPLGEKASVEIGLVVTGGLL